MARFFKKRKELLGEVPGSLVFIGQQKVEVPSIQLIKYNDKNLIEQDIYDVPKIREFLDTENIIWLNIIGIHDSKFINDLGSLFGIHPLALEDIMNTAQRAKFEEFEDYSLFALKMLQNDIKTDKIKAEQLSIILKDNIIISFQEIAGDVFFPVRDRIRKAKGRIRSKNADYLCYALIDSVIENYVSITERTGEKIELLEEKILSSTDTKLIKEINYYKSEINFLGKLIRPAKELIMKYQKYETLNDNKFILPFIRDLQDLYYHTLESTDTYRDILNDYLDVYHSNLNLKINKIMTILTIFSAVFIPITFLAGVYGMNFEYLPELQFKYSYLIFWIIVISTTTGMLYYFKKKNWF